MPDPPLLLHTDAQGRATLTLNRPEVHNAFDDNLISEMTCELKRLDACDTVRVVLLAARGVSFSAGADLNWMRRTAGYTAVENKEDALKLAELMQTLNNLSKPTIALVQGPAFGGGVGLVACCDMALATPYASFCLSEVKLGLIPAVISPYVVSAIGSRAARRYILTAERFSAIEALHLGLVNEVVGDQDIHSRADTLSRKILENGPLAVKEAKKLISDVARHPIDDRLIADTAERIAKIRTSAEGKEGLGAFLDKRCPAWIKR